MVERAKKMDDLEKALAVANKKATRLREKLKASEEQVRKVTSEKLTAQALAKSCEDDYKRLQASVKGREECVMEIERLVAESKKVIADGKIELAQEGARIRKAARRDLTDLWKRKKLDYQKQGVLHSQLTFLGSPVGQEFLRVMHRGLLETFVQTKNFCRAALKGFGVLVSEAIRVACEQMEVSAEQEAKLDRSAFKTKMDVGAVNASLGLDPTLPSEWWIPVMERAAKLLIERDNTDPGLPKERLYNLPYLNNLTAEFLEEVCLKKTVSIGSDLSEGAMVAIDEVCGPIVTPEEDAAFTGPGVSGSPMDVGHTFPTRVEEDHVISESAVS